MLKEILEAQKPEDAVLSIITNSEEYESWIGSEIFEIADKFGYLFRLQYTADNDDVSSIFQYLVKGKYDDYVVDADYNVSTYWAFKKKDVKKCLAEMNDLISKNVE